MATTCCKQVGHAARDYGAGYLPSLDVRPAHRRSSAMKFLLLEWHRQKLKSLTAFAEKILSRES